MASLSYFLTFYLRILLRLWVFTQFQTASWHQIRLEMPPHGQGSSWLSWLTRDSVDAVFDAHVREDDSRLVQHYPKFSVAAMDCSHWLEQVHGGPDKTSMLSDPLVRTGSLLFALFYLYVWVLYLIIVCRRRYVDTHLCTIGLPNKHGLGLLPGRRFLLNILWHDSWLL